MTTEELKKNLDIRHFKPNFSYQITYRVGKSQLVSKVRYIGVTNGYNLNGNRTFQFERINKKTKQTATMAISEALIIHSKQIENE